MKKGNWLKRQLLFPGEDLVTDCSIDTDIENQKEEETNLLKYH